MDSQQQQQQQQPRYGTHPLPRSVRAPSRWASRIIPLVLLCIVAFTSWVETAAIWLECTTQHHIPISQRTSDALLAVHYVLLVVMILVYGRVYLTINTNPGATPTIDLGNAGEVDQDADAAASSGPKRSVACHIFDRLRKHKEPEDQLVIRKFRYQIASAPVRAPEHRLSVIGNTETKGPFGYFPSRHRMDQFYTKDVFVCDIAGLPIWCNQCRIWKPDRAHHSSEMERCIRKMDHYCPWVGGMVSETSFNFFYLFTFWAAVYCTFVLVTSSYVMALRNNAGMSVNAPIAVCIGLSAFFGLFTATMTLTSLRFILLNLTNVEALALRTKVHHLAVRVPNGSAATDKYKIRTYPLVDWHQPSQAGVCHPTAEHTFAIVQTQPGEHPWRAGYWANWVSVMGRNPVGWFLPVWHSPCMREGHSTTSQYQLGPLVEDLRVRFGVPTMG